jgi:hypothetical protein
MAKSCMCIAYGLGIPFSCFTNAFIPSRIRECVHNIVGHKQLIMIIYLPSPFDNTQVEPVWCRSFSVYNLCFIGDGFLKWFILDVGIVLTCYRMMWVPIAYIT